MELAPLRRYSNVFKLHYPNRLNFHGTIMSISDVYLNEPLIKQGAYVIIGKIEFCFS